MSAIKEPTLTPNERRLSRTFKNKDILNRDPLQALFKHPGFSPASPHEAPSQKSVAYTVSPRSDPIAPSSKDPPVSCPVTAPVVPVSHPAAAVVAQKSPEAPAAARRSERNFHVPPSVMKKVPIAPLGEASSPAIAPSRSGKAFPPSLSPSSSAAQLDSASSSGNHLSLRTSAPELSGSAKSIHAPPALNAHASRLPRRNPSPGQGRARSGTFHFVDPTPPLVVPANSSTPRSSSFRKRLDPAEVLEIARTSILGLQPGAVPAAVSRSADVLKEKAKLEKKARKEARASKKVRKEEKRKRKAGLEAQAKIEAEHAALAREATKAEIARLEKERLEKENLEKEKLEKERKEKEQAERNRLEKEKERLDKERELLEKEKERIETERQEKKEMTVVMIVKKEKKAKKEKKEKKGKKAKKEKKREERERNAATSSSAVAASTALLPLAFGSAVPTSASSSSTSTGPSSTAATTAAVPSLSSTVHSTSSRAAVTTSASAKPRTLPSPRKSPRLNSSSTTALAVKHTSPRTSNRAVDAEDRRHSSPRTSNNALAVDRRHTSPRSSSNAIADRHTSPRSSGPLPSPGRSQSRSGAVTSTSGTIASFSPPSSPARGASSPGRSADVGIESAATPVQRGPTQARLRRTPSDLSAKRRQRRRTQENLRLASKVAMAQPQPHSMSPMAANTTVAQGSPVTRIKSSPVQPVANGLKQQQPLPPPLRTASGPSINQRESTAVHSTSPRRNASRAVVPLKDAAFSRQPTRHSHGRTAAIAAPWEGIRKELELEGLAPRRSTAPKPKPAMAQVISLSPKSQSVGVFSKPAREQPPVHHHQHKDSNHHVRSSPHHQSTGNANAQQQRGRQRAVATSENRDSRRSVHTLIDIAKLKISAS